MRRKPAACSKALAPRRGTFLIWAREVIFPSSSRYLTIFSEIVLLSPATWASSAGLAVLILTPT